MAQTGYTPILIYSSSTGGNAPAAGNLTNSTLGSELAINITDGKLFYKDNANAVQVIGWKTTPTTAGGTGLTSYTAGDLLYYSTGTTLSKLAIGSSGQILKSTGSAPAWENVSALAVTSISFGTTGLTPSTATQGAVTVAGTLVAANGGTGQSSYTVGDILYASGTTTLSKLADVATGNALISGGVGVAPSWGKIGLTTHVSGTLPIANGGTNQTSFTGKSGNIAGLVFFDGTSLTNDSTVSHVGYDTAANTFYAYSQNITNNGDIAVSGTTFSSPVLNIGSASTTTGSAFINTTCYPGLPAYNSGIGFSSGGLVSATTINKIRSLGIYSAGFYSALAFNTTSGTVENEVMRLYSSTGVSIGNTTDPGAGSLSINADLKFNSGYGSVAQAYGCRAWVNFNGTGTPAIRGSGNVTSITDRGVGQYTVNMTTAMPDRNYSAVASAGYYAGVTDSTYCNIDQFGNETTSGVPIVCKQDGGTYYDPDWVCCAVFR